MTSNAPALELALQVAGGAILLFLAIIGWFIRDKMRLRERTENLLAKRLEAGTEVMKEQRAEMQEVRSELRTVKDQVKDFDGKHVTIEKHEALEQELSMMAVNQAETREAINGLGTRMEQGFSILTKLLQAKVVDNPEV